VALTEAGLYDASGRELARFDQMRGTDRGAFAFKPSSGFVVALHRPAPPLWAPGLYWRFGRSLGIGGVTRAVEARAMADLVAMHLATAAATARAVTTADADADADADATNADAEANATSATTTTAAEANATTATSADADAATTAASNANANAATDADAAKPPS